MNRRNFLELAAATALAGNARAAHTEQSPRLQFTRTETGIGPYLSARTGKAPNIFLISMDMVSPDLYHPARPFSQHVQIPAIRSLMHDGTFFSNAFCTVPVCAPSRASYLTGRYSYIQGNGERAPQGLETELRPDDIIFPEYLVASGYVARHAGKSHVGTKKFIDAFGENDHPWNRWSPPVFDDEEFLTYQRALGVKPQKYSREIVFLQQDRKTPGNSAGGWVVQEDGKPFPLEAHYSYFLGKKLIETLEDLIENGTAAKHPLYLQLDIFDPHQPFSIPAGFEKREKELRAVMTLPDSYRATQERDFARAANDPEILDIYRRYWGIYDPHTLLDYRVAYALQMEIVDQVIGMVLGRVRELGLYDDALVVLISDHGEMNGRHALVDKGVYHYPDTLRVPLVVKPPRALESKPGTISQAVSLLDLSQLMLDAAGIKPQAKFDGHSLLPLLKGAGQKLPRRSLLFFGGWHVGVNFACGLQHTRDDGRQFVYTYNASSPHDQLYDLDAVDAVNLIDAPEYEETRRTMLRMLGDALQADPRWVGYWSEFRVARYADLPRATGDMQMFTQPV